MNNPKRVDNLLALSNDRNLIFEIVATSDEKDLAALDNFLDEFVDTNTLSIKKHSPKPLLLQQGTFFSLITIGIEDYKKQEIVVITYFLGQSPMNWREEFFEEAEKYFTIDNRSIYMRLNDSFQDNRIVPVK